MIILGVIALLIICGICIYTSMKFSTYMNKKYNWDYGLTLIITAYSSFILCMGLILQIIYNLTT